ncbi:hypothetical protein EL45_15270 [Cellulophaga sp. E6(2014)]|nr:hypothetical protein EL45_15270 [Cellulophaga sp. E6(2014)]
MKLSCLGTQQQLWNKKPNLSVNHQLENKQFQNFVESLRFQDQRLKKSYLGLNIEAMKDFKSSLEILEAHILMPPVKK